MTTKNHKGERIARRIARAGVCSRRAAEKLIDQGRVRVNGKTIDSPAPNVTSDDMIVVDGKPLPGKEETRLFLYHKPSGLVTTHKDDQGRATVFDNLPGHLPRVISVGRLDLNSEGLLLLTNDGDLSRALELPSTGWTRRYRVRVFGVVSDHHLQDLKKGITVDGVRYKSIIAAREKPDTPIPAKPANIWLSITLKEGKNREIRKVMNTLDLQVSRLVRTGYGPFELGKLNPSAVEEVKPHILKAQLGKIL